MGLMDRKNVFNAFDFDNHFILDQQIKPVAAIQLNALVLDRQRALPLKGDSLQVNFMAEAFFVCRFEEPGTKRPVDLDCCADYALREFFMKKFAPCLRVSVVN